MQLYSVQIIYPIIFLAAADTFSILVSSILVDIAPAIRPAGEEAFVALLVQLSMVKVITTEAPVVVLQEVVLVVIPVLVVLQEVVFVVVPVLVVLQEVVPVVVLVLVIPQEEVLAEVLQGVILVVVPILVIILLAVGLAKLYAIVKPIQPHHQSLRLPT